MLGGALGFSGFGSGITNAKRDTELDAELSFHTGFLERPREEGTPTFELLATLTGKLKLVGSRPVFSAEDPTAMKYAAPIPGEDSDVEANGGKALLKLGLVCASPSFGASAGLPEELKLPAIPEEARFLEIAMALTVNGAEEASIEQNDRLDVPLEHIAFFKAKLEDDQGVPFADEQFELKLVDGSIISGRTDAEGRVASTPVPKGRCKLRLIFGADPDARAPDAEKPDEGTARDGDESASA